MSEKFSLPEKLFSTQEEKSSPKGLWEKLGNAYYLPLHREILTVFARCGDCDDYYKLCGEWHRFCRDEKHPVFEFLNQEYIEALTNYLEQRTKELQKTVSELITILEVGAGDGRLTHFLGQKLEEKGISVKMIATDTGEEGVESVFPVETLSYKEALRKYNPTIVIACWMPMKQDWTAEFRATQSVQEYLLIGEKDMGCCGDEWLTWGRDWLPGLEGKTPPYEADGFERYDLSEISKLQIARSDRPGEYGQSHTVSFRRRK
ncbi:MAG: hypothetical protein FJ044_00775 [Candidatus Cloacimonetes bacterium]|nr:hypothetical protein [Candidatus Cloacimonadota bacterium]